MTSHHEHKIMASAELAYLLVNKRWGWRIQPQFENALGAFLSDHWHGYDLHLLAAFLYKNKIGIDHFGNRVTNIQTPLYASLMKFLSEIQDQNFLRFVCTSPFLREPQRPIFLSLWEKMLYEKFASNPALDTIQYFNRFR